MMRIAFLLAAMCAATLATSCGENGPAAPSTDLNTRLLSETGKVVVRVHWENEGLPGKLVEIVELGLVRTTNEDGLAKFAVPAGSYTARVYEINRGGPPMHFVDTKVTVTIGDEVRVEVVDCIPCV